MTEWDTVLTPRPRFVMEVAGSVDLSRGLLIESRSNPDLDGSEHLIAELRAAGIAVERDRAEAGPDWVRCALELTGAEESGLRAEQGYRLVVDADGVVIGASTLRGLHHGSMTLLQMLRHAAAGDGLVGCVEVLDWPETAMRLYSEDLARGQVPTLNDLCRIVSYLGELKISHFVLYLEDMFEFASHPDIGKSRGRLTRDEIAALHAHAVKHHVELVPAIQTLGHMERILELPNYRHLREHPDNESLLGPDRPGAYALISDLLDDLSRAFPSQFVVVGADEAWGLGTGSTSGRLEAEGAAGLWLDHVRRVAALAAARGKTAVVACDMFDDAYYRDVFSLPAPFDIGRARELPPDVVPAVACFLPAAEHPLLVDLTQHGWSPWVVTTIANYTRLYPRYPLVADCVAAVTDLARATGAAAVVASAFCDQGGDNLHTLNDQGIALLADATWNPTPRAYRDAVRAFASQYFGAADPHLVAVLELLGGSDDLFPRPPVPAGSEPVDVFGMRGWVWFHLWKLLDVRPFLSILDEQECALLRRSAALLQQARQDLLLARPAVRRNELRLDDLGYALDWVAHTVDRVLVLGSASDLISRGESPSVGDELRRLASDVRGLKSTFAELWRRTCREPGLVENLNRLDGVADGLEELAVEVAAGRGRLAIP